MPTRVIKTTGGKFKVVTPSGTHAKHTTKAKAEAQARLINAVHHGYKPGKKRQEHKIKIDIGCGRKKKEDFIGIDKYDFTGFYRKGEFICADVTKDLPFDDESIDGIFADQLIEHIPKDKFIPFMNECWRILKSDAEFEIIFPPAIDCSGNSNRDFFTDPTHVNSLLEGSFYVFVEKFRKATLEEYNMDYSSYGIKTNFEFAEIAYITPTQLRIILIKKR